MGYNYLIGREVNSGVAENGTACTGGTTVRYRWVPKSRLTLEDVSLSSSYISGGGIFAFLGDRWEADFLSMDARRYALAIPLTFENALALRIQLMHYCGDRPKSSFAPRTNGALAHELIALCDRHALYLEGAGTPYCLVITH